MAWPSPSLPQSKPKPSASSTGALDALAARVPANERAAWVDSAAEAKAALNATKYISPFALGGFFAPTVLPDNIVITPNLNNGLTFIATLGGNRQIANIENQKIGFLEHRERELKAVQFSARKRADALLEALPRD